MYEADAARFGAVARLFRSTAAQDAAPVRSTCLIQDPAQPVMTAGEGFGREANVERLMGKGAARIKDEFAFRSGASTLPMRVFTRAGTGPPKAGSAPRDGHSFAARVASFETARALAAARGGEGGIRLSEAQLGAALGAAGLSAWRSRPHAGAETRLAPAGPAA